MKAVEVQDLTPSAVELSVKPQLKGSLDAIVRITTTGICRHYLQFIRRTENHHNSGSNNNESLGIVEIIGDGVKRLAVGDRVLIPNFIHKSYCPCCQDQEEISAIGKNLSAISNNVLNLGKNLTHMPNHQVSYVQVPCADRNLIKLEDSSGDN